MKESRDIRKTGSVLRRFALALPQVEELIHMGAPSFRVNGKIFAQLAEKEQVALLKLTLDEQDALLRSNPDDVWLPKHWGQFGWTYVRLEGMRAERLQGLIAQSWSLIAPKTLVASFHERPK